MSFRYTDHHRAHTRHIVRMCGCVQETLEMGWRGPSPITGEIWAKSIHTHVSKHWQCEAGTKRGTFVRFGLTISLWHGLQMRKVKHQEVGNRLKVSPLVVCVCVLNRFSCVWLIATLWTVVHQAPLSVRILQARILEWVTMPPPGDLPILRLLHWQAGSLPLVPSGKSHFSHKCPRAVPTVSSQRSYSPSIFMKLMHLK